MNFLRKQIYKQFCNAHRKHYPEHNPFLLKKESEKYIEKQGKKCTCYSQMEKDQGEKFLLSNLLPLGTGIDGIYIVKKDPYVHPAFPKKEKTIVIYCHGNKRNICSCSHMLPLLDFFGIDLVLFDYYGFGNSVDDTHSVPYSPQSLINSTVSVVNYFLKDEKSKVILYGHSLG